MGAAEPNVLAPSDTDADLERRFGGLRRLYGKTGYERLRRGRVAVVGLGGVGSWSVEALARSGVAQLTLIDLDHVAESNINRQVQATDETLGTAKGEALRQRIASIHPGCEVRVVDAFVEANNWPQLLGDGPLPNILIDACDDARAKRLLATWALSSSQALITVGAAGGKRQPQAVECADLAEVTHDPLLARLRTHLRKAGGVRVGAQFGLRCVFSREPVTLPLSAMAGAAPGDACEVDGSLNCHGYGSSVAVTAAFGFVAAAEAIECLVGSRTAQGPRQGLDS